ncbi:MAG: hypothetical protein MJA30_15620 [Cytophagales bacterium]|nr:hypothetical protein [Cytophagales bacterium]
MNIKPFMYTALFIAPMFHCQGQTSNERSQSPEEEKPLTYLDSNEGFEYLDEDYRISIPSHTFDSTYQLYPFRTKNPGSFSYEDSLSVVLAIKHNGFNRAHRYEMYKVLFKLETVGFYLHTSAEETRSLKEQLNVKTWYDVFYYFKDSTQQSAIKEKYISLLKGRYYDQWQDSSIYAAQSAKEAMYIAFHKGAKERIRKVHEERGIKPPTR